jgi:uncharacterized protein (TIGR03435 family)
MGARPSRRHTSPLGTASRILSIALIAISTPLIARVSAQAPAPVAFDVVSIKHVDELRPGGSDRTLPDGTVMMMNGPLGALISSASPVPVTPRDIVGMPDWMMRERYDVTAKPPAGLTREQLRDMMPAMWRAMFADRMKLVAHVEQHEKDAYALVLARSDGRLGPDLKPSTLDCTPRPDATAPTPPQTLPSLQERQNRCGMSMSPGLIVSGSVTLDRFARSLSGLAGGETENRTGLTGSYSVTLTFSRQRSAGASLNPNAPIDDAPDIFTAVQEQLGLKLQHEKKMVPVFVIDHIERPSEN